MNNFFKYVEKPSDESVTLNLFAAPNGNPQGDVSGPIPGIANSVFSDVVELVRCFSLEDAFQAGIRMANKNDTELVVTGNRALWLAKWGELEQPSIGAATVLRT